MRPERYGAYHEAADIVAEYPEGVSSSTVGKRLGLSGTAATMRLRRAEEHGLVRMEGISNGARWFPGPVLEQRRLLDEAGVPEAPPDVIDALSWRQGYLAGLEGRS